MKNTFFKSLLLVGLLLHLSCRKVIDIPELNHSSQLVVKGAIGAGEDRITLVFSESMSVLNDKPIPYLKDGVEARLFEDGIELAPPRIVVLDVIYFWDNDPWGTNSQYDTVYGFVWDVAPQQGSNYRLIATHNGRKIEANTTVPLATQIQIKTIRTGEPIEYNFQINDPEPNIMNYYMLRLVNEDFGTMFFSIPNDRLIFNWETSGIDFEEPGYEEFFIRGFFTDESFNANGIRNITMRISLFGGEGIEGSEIQVLTLNPLFYTYLKSTTLNLSMIDNPFTEPVTVPSNIEGGLGLFTSFAIAKAEL